MVKSEETVIDGIELRTTQLPAMRAFALLARLIKALGPVLGSLAELDPAAEISLAAPALAGALSTLDPREAATLVQDVFAATAAKPAGGKFIELIGPGNIDLAFSGRLKTMLMALAWVLKVNYADFFDAAPAAPTTT